MISIRWNSRVKPQRNRKTFWKNKKIKPFRDNDNWEGINYPSENNDWRKFEKNDISNASNISCLCFKRQLTLWKLSYSAKDGWMDG